MVKKERKGFLERIKEAQSKKTEKQKKINAEEKQEKSVLPPKPVNDFVKDSRILKAYKYAEVHRMREGVVKIISKNNAKTCVITSPEDGVGNTFITCVIGLNIAFFTSMNVLIVDANLRRPEFHNIFKVQKEKGIIDVICRDIAPKDVIKRMSYNHFSLVTSGEERSDLSKYINRSVLEYFLNEIKDDFDLILFDTSPVLINNRNNIDPSVLSSICDITFLTVLEFETTKAELKEMVEIITKSGGKIGGILYNRYISPKFSFSYLLNMLGFKK